VRRRRRRRRRRKERIERKWRCGGQEKGWRGGRRRGKVRERIMREGKEKEEEKVGSIRLRKNRSTSPHLTSTHTPSPQREDSDDIYP
jgi:hypothetical protein